jgi:hypothetical protein
MWQGKWWFFSCLSCLGVSCAAEKATPVGPPRPARVIELWLGQPVGRIKGFTWRRTTSGDLSRLEGDRDPCKALIHLPSGRRVACDTRWLMLSQMDGVLDKVTLAPAPRLLPYQQAVAAARDAVRVIDPEDPRDLYTRIEEWAKVKEPGRVSRAGKGVVERRVTVFAQVTPRDEGKPDVWHAEIDISYHLDAQQFEKEWGAGK